MENRDEQQIKAFFNKNKFEIQDNGFSNQVYHKLPEKRYRKVGWIVPVFAFLGVAIAGFIIDVQKVIFEIYNLILSVPIYYLLGGIMVFPILILAGFFLWEKSQYPDYLVR